MEDENVYIIHYTVSMGRWMGGSEKVKSGLMPIGKSEQGYTLAYDREELISSIAENINDIFDRIEPSFNEELEKIKKDTEFIQLYIYKELQNER